MPVPAVLSACNYGSHQPELLSMWVLRAQLPASVRVSDHPSISMDLTPARRSMTVASTCPSKSSFYSTNDIRRSRRRREISEGLPSGSFPGVAKEEETRVQTRRRQPQRLKVKGRQLTNKNKGGRGWTQDQGNPRIT